MSRRHATLAVTLAGLSLLAAGCGGGGGSDAGAETTPLDPAALLAAEAAAVPVGLVDLGVTIPDSADGRLRAYQEFGTPADVFAPLVSESAGTTTVPSAVVPATTVPTTVTTPTTGTTTPAEGSFVP